jgi:hypothetical protein
MMTGGPQAKEKCEAFISAADRVHQMGIRKGSKINRTQIPKSREGVDPDDDALMEAPQTQVKAKL